MKKTEIIYIKFNSEIDNMSFISKNLYNFANYIVRNEFIQNRKWIRYNELYTLCKDNENYKILPAQTAQQVLRVLDKNWKSFFKSIKQYKKNKSSYTGMPKLPKYKDKIKGRNILIYPFQHLRIDNNNYIKIPKTNYKIKISDRLIGNKINELRIIPTQSTYKIEIVYDFKSKEINNDIKNIISIDLGINNFSTCFNNFGLNPLIINGKNIKSINQYYNKQKANIQSELKIKNDRFGSKKLYKLTHKRNNKIMNNLHSVSRYIINYAIYNDVDTIIVGQNKQWKTDINLGKKTNQSFVNIPHSKFINILKYKSEESGIKFKTIEESYTSKVDHLANEQLKPHEEYLGKRIKRGLFQSSVNKLINADVNGAIGIMKKVIGNDLIYPIQGLVFNPIKITIQ